MMSLEVRMLRSFKGKTPRVADSAFISETAYVIGDVEVGENSGIWPGAVVRADFGSVKIGQSSHIEDNCVLHCDAPMEIGNNVIIGHSVVMHGKKIGNNTLIGNNATILDNVEIGSFCLIGAGCLVTPGVKIPDESLVVGVPGEVKEKLSPRQMQRIQDGAQIYSELARQYKEQGL
jgi:carbonic anhydrase/acetyltransferase-like protein (isoleucine patch superfamily)